MTASSAFTLAVDKPTVSLVFTVELTAGRTVSGWTMTSGNIFQSPLVLTPDAVLVEGTAIPERTSVDRVGRVGGWFWDPTAALLYVNTFDLHGYDPWAAEVQASVTFRFSNRPKVLGGYWFDPRLKTVPNLSLRIEPRFSGIGQIGGGKCQLVNSDRYFHGLSDMVWDAGLAVVKCGIDWGGGSMAWSDYLTIGTWKVQRADIGEDVFSLTIEERETGLGSDVPTSTFAKTNYPNISRENEGKPIPRIYGRVFGVEPICVDNAGKRFKVADHPIAGLDAVRIQNSDTEAWVDASFVSVDLSSAEFTLGAGWDASASVVVDVSGRMDSAGVLMTNAADIVADLLAYVGETNLNTASFAASKAALRIGTTTRGWPVDCLKPSLYIGDPTSVRDVISTINQAVGSCLYVDANGQWLYRVFCPTQFAGAPVLTTSDLLDPVSAVVDSRDIFTRVDCDYAQRVTEGWKQNLTQLSEPLRNRHRLTTHRVNKVEAPFWDEADARLYSQRLLSTEGESLVTYETAIPWRGFMLTPGDIVRVSDTYSGVDTFLEVIEVSQDLSKCIVSLKLGNLRGWGNTFGHWAGDSDPSWSTGATDTEKQTARALTGFWAGYDGKASSTDGKSVNAGRWW